MIFKCLDRKLLVCDRNQMLFVFKLDNLKDRYSIASVLTLDIVLGSQDLLTEGANVSLVSFLGSVRLFISMFLSVPH